MNIAAGSGGLEGEGGSRGGGLVGDFATRNLPLGLLGWVWVGLASMDDFVGCGARQASRVGAFPGRGPWERGYKWEGARNRKRVVGAAAGWRGVKGFLFVTPPGVESFGGWVRE